MQGSNFSILTDHKMHVPKWMLYFVNLNISSPIKVRQKRSPLEIRVPRWMSPTGQPAGSQIEFLCANLHHQDENDKVLR